jgi:hypothetical protein
MEYISTLISNWFVTLTVIIFYKKFISTYITNSQFFSLRSFKTDYFIPGTALPFALKYLADGNVALFSFK